MTTKKTRKARGSAAREAADKLARPPGFQNAVGPAEDPYKALRTELFAKLKSEGDLSPEDKSALEEARAILSDVSRRMLAMARAASERWKPALSVFDVDETAGPIIGDDEFSDIVDVTELTGEVALLRHIGLFMGLPAEIVDAVAAERLRTLVLPASRIAPLHHVAHRRGKAPGPPAGMDS